MEQAVVIHPATTAPDVPSIPADRGAVTPMQMLQIAVERGADLDRLQQLMDLQERWERNEARKAFVAALAEFKKSPPELGKNKQVSFTTRAGDTTQYKHATLDEVALKIGQALSPHGLSYTWNVEQKDGAVVVTCILTHRMGHSESVTMQAPPDTSGTKNSIQAIGSTTTYLQRYTLLAVTGMAVKGQDDDGRGAGVAEDGLSEQAYADHMAAIEAAADPESIDKAWQEAAAACHAAKDAKAHAALKGKVIERKAALKAKK